MRLTRILARLRDGFAYDDIAREEGLTPERVRQIVSESLQTQPINSGSDHAKLQLVRLASPLKLAAEAIAAGDVRAIGPYLKVLDRLDYQSVSQSNQVYDEETRRKLLDKLNQAAAVYHEQRRKAEAAAGKEPAPPPDEAGEDLWEADEGHSDGALTDTGAGEVQKWLAPR